jgi:hypothetical protein
MRRVVIVLAGVLVCVGLATVAIAATASDGRNPSVTLARSGSFQDYQLSSDASGAATVAWSAEDIVHGMAGAVLGVREQDAQGNWIPSTQLGSIAQYSVPQLAESPSGAAVIVVTYARNKLQAPRSGVTVVEAFTRGSPTSRWSAPITVSSRPKFESATATVGIDSAGIATVVWADYSAHPSIWTANVNSSNAAVTGASRLAAPGQGGTDFHLAVNPAGDALLSWRSETPALAGEAQLVHATEMVAYRTSAAAWGSPYPLASFTFENAIGAEVWGPESPSVALTANGNAAVAWIAGLGNTSVPLRIATYNAARKSWTSPHLLSANPNGFGVAATGNRSFLSVWSTGPHAKLMNATTSDGSNWSAGKRLSQYPHPSDLDDYLANDQKGDVTLTLSGPHSQIFYLTRKTDGDWSAAKSAGTGASPEVTVSDDGATTVLWDQVRQPASLLEARAIR